MANARGRRVTRGYRAAAAAGMLAVGGCASNAMPAPRLAHRPTLAAAGCVVMPATGSDPFPGGYQTTVAGARAAVGFPVLVPHTALANRGSLTAVWVNPGQRLVALVYDEGRITILMEPWPVPQSPARWFRYERGIMIRKYAVVGRVNGGPALIVLRPNIDYCHANSAVVEFSAHGVDIDVHSRDYRSGPLLKIAASMR